jgi:hypothetical protein
VATYKAVERNSPLFVYPSGSLESSLRSERRFPACIDQSNATELGSTALKTVRFKITLLSVHIYKLELRNSTQHIDNTLLSNIYASVTGFHVRRYLPRIC